MSSNRYAVTSRTHCLNPDDGILILGLNLRMRRACSESSLTLFKFKSSGGSKNGAAQARVLV